MFSLFDKYSDEYEKWFTDNMNLFQSELLALKQVVPKGMNGLEIGIGTGLFAEKLGIKYGIDPSDKMLCYARRRNLKVEKGIAEKLPYFEKSFDFAAFITSLCFIDNPVKAMKEAYRVIKDNGDLIVAFIDKNSLLGKSLEKVKKESKFYRDAKFYSVDEMRLLIEENGFEIIEIFQTLVKMDSIIPETPLKGYGDGGFVVIKGMKK